MLADHVGWIDFWKKGATNQSVSHIPHQYLEVEEFVVSVF